MRKNIIVTDMRNKLLRVSRWIKVRHAENITPRNALYYWAENARGYRCSDGDSDGANVYYFVFRGRRYALNEFTPLTLPEIYDTPDKRGIIGYMQIETSHPLLLEYIDAWTLYEYMKKSKPALGRFSFYHLAGDVARLVSFHRARSLHPWYN